MIDRQKLEHLRADLGVALVTHQKHVQVVTKPRRAIVRGRQRASWLPLIASDSNRCCTRGVGCSVAHGLFADVFPQHLTFSRLAFD